MRVLGNKLRFFALSDISFGIFLSTSYDWDSNRFLTLEAERLGYDTVYMTDHLTAGKVPRIESLTTLAALAPITERIRFGQMVLCYAFRNPALLAKIGATLDIISKGRFELGLGAGWCQEEFESYGYLFLSHKERLDALREAVIIIKKMWTEDTPTFKGRHFSIEEAYCQPKPVQKPRPPIMIGGESKRVLKLAAEIGDIYNTLCLDLGRFEEKMSSLKEYCEHTGRDFSSLKKSFGFHLNIYKDELSLMKHLKEAYEAQERSEDFDEWIETSRDEIYGYLYKIHGRQHYSGEIEQVLKRTEAYIDRGASCIMLKFGDHPRDRRMMTLFKREVADRINH